MKDEVGVEAVDERGVAHAGDRPHPLEQVLVEGGDGTELFVPRARRVDLRGQDARRVVPEVDVRQAPEAIDHQPAADEQHHRQRDLGHDQRRAETVARPRRPGAVLQGFVEVDPREPERRDQAEDEAGQRATARTRTPERVASIVKDAAREFALVRDSGSPLARNRTAQFASTSPTAPPRTASSALSTSNWRATRRRPAPRAARIAISLRLTFPRTSRRLAMLAQAIRSTNPTAAINSDRMGRTCLVITVWGTASRVRTSEFGLAANSLDEGVDLSAGLLDRDARFEARDRLEVARAVVLVGRP